MQDDLSGINKEADFDPMYSGYEAAEPADRAEREDALPRGIYFVEFQAGKARFSKDADARLGRPIPGIRLGAKVLEGPEGTVGRVGFGSLNVYPSSTKYEKGDGGKRSTSTKSDKEYQDDLQKHLGVLKRVASVLGLVRGLPAKPHTEDTLNEFGKQFAGKRAVLDISQLPGNEQFDASNLFIWASVARPDEQVKDKATGKVKGTALEEARKAIAKANQKAATKKTLTTEAFGASQPSGF